MLLIAHRGASADAPENTLEAFQLAWQQGADAIETDLRLTADGHVVALHDPTLTRTTGIRRSLRHLTFTDLRHLAPTVPSLPEILAICPPHARVVLELKEGTELLAGIDEALATRPDIRPTFIAFDHAVIAATKAHFPDHPALWLVDKISADLPARLDAAHLDGIDLRYSPTLTHSKLEIRESKILYVFTVNDPAAAAHCEHLGVQALTTDHPARFSRAAPTNQA
jgi:glycerophosphoryl diester phosphodiesterase